MGLKPIGILITLMLLWVTQGIGQTYILNSTTNGQTYNTCLAQFYDSNTSGNYGNNEDYVITFYPSVANKVLRIDFSILQLAFDDNLTVYDGPNTSAPVLINYDYLNNGILTVTAKNAAGCLTFHFRSDGSGVAAGWQGLIKCVPACQPFSGSFTTIPPVDPSGAVTICPTAPNITLSANIIYPNNGVGYTQSNATSKFYWRTGFSNDTSGLNLTTLTKTITQHAGYRVTLSVVDVNGCSIDQPLQVKVRTSKKPKFNVSQPAPFCQGDTANLIASPVGITGAYIVPPFSGHSLFLPDGNGVSYADTIRITDFAPGQTLNKIDDFLGVFMTMEHSYLGDLDIQLIAPNGNTVILKQYPGGGACQLGEPVDFDNFPNVTGIGYLYGFTPNPSHATMVAESNLYTYSYTDVLGNVYNNRRYLPAGNYTSFTPLSNLLGTPLNGNWIIRITDHLNSDNGYIFNWSLSFDQSVYPNVETYAIGIKDLKWLPTSGLISGSGANAVISPLSAGNNNFTLRITDSANCFYDSIVTVNAIAAPQKPALGADKTLCAGQTIPLTVSNVYANTTYLWNTGVTGTTINVNQPGIYNVRGTNSAGCKSRDTIVVSNDVPISVNINGDTAFCTSATNILQSGGNSNIASYAWNNGSIQPTLSITGPGIYWVEGTSAAGCKIRDSVTVTANPINSWVAPNDSSVCGANVSISLSNYPAGTNFLWSDGVNGPVRNFISGGNFEITADYNGCIKKDSLKINVNPVPSVNLGADTFYCASNPNTLHAIVNGTITSYNWNNGQTTADLPITGQGIYWLKVMTNKGCFAVDTINVTNNPINNWQAPADSNICGTSLTLSLANYPAGTGFLWNDGGNETIKTFTSSGSYTIEANYLGCSKQEDVTVGIRPFPNVDLPVTTLFCNSSANVLHATITGNVTGLLWNTGAGPDSLVLTDTGTYWLEAVTQYGCKYRDTAIVIFNPINDWKALADNSICDESTYTAVMKNYPAGTTFLWYDGSTSISHSFTKAGSYRVDASYLGCLKKDSVTLAVRPLPVISLGKDSSTCTGFTIPLKAYYPGATYLWSNGKTDSAISVKSSGIYSVKATLNGCDYSDEVQINFLDCDCHLSIPNAFSPNNDGINDVLRVHLECYPRNYNFSVFDRYGRKVFETRDYTKTWNGEMNGKPIPIGTYYYVLSFYNGSLERNEQKTGYIILLK